MSTTLLKLIALVMMLIDHIATYIPGMPVWMHWIGRLAAPVFLFCMLWGFFHTHDRKIYLKRMYLFGFGMAVLDFAANVIVKDSYEPMTNDIFATLFLVGVMVWIVEIYMEDSRRGLKYAVVFLLFQAVSLGICNLALEMVPVKGIETIVASILPNVIYAEGGINFIAMGVILYFVRNKKVYFSLVFAAFAGLIFLSEYGEAANMARLVSKEGCQWMMIFALPFMLLYNGKKGKGFKYLFYVFYPLHILMLFVIGNVM